MTSELEQAINELVRVLQYGGYRCYWEPQSNYIRLTIIMPDGYHFVERLYSVNDVYLAIDIFRVGYMTRRKS
jgi:L-ribulose-5-phosphate 3-epimerase UlaE